MSTNFYLQTKRPREVYDEFHIAKTSGGWRPSFQADPNPELAYHGIELEEPEPLAIGSVDDLKRHYDTGLYRIVDEYGGEYTWEEFEKRVLEFCPDGHEHESAYDFPVHKDPQGYDFIHRDYR